MSRKARKFKGFRPKLGDLQKKKRSSPKLRLIFRPISQIQTFEGGYFPFFTENRPQKHKKHAILHTSQANGGARAPSRPPPGYATGRNSVNFCTVPVVPHAVASLFFCCCLHKSCRRLGSKTNNKNINKNIVWNTV